MRNAIEEDDENFARWIELWDAAGREEGKGFTTSAFPLELLREKYDAGITPPGWSG